MAYKLLEHEADIGVLGIGKTVEEAFQEGAKAMFSIMADIEKIEPKKEIEIECEADALDILFVEWLNRLISEKDIEEMLFSEFEVRIEQTELGYKLTGKARGEKIDQDKHAVKIEVKAATYHGLKYEIKEEVREGKAFKKHYVQCVVDV